jgi:beta-lactamase regulating signal transducer with metallopeptidase domain
MITFLQVNLLMAITYFLYFGIQKLDLFFKFDSSSKAFLRSAQLLIFLSLAAPILIKLIPTKQLPVNHYSFQVFSENSSSNFKSTKMKINSIVKAAPAKVETLENSVSFNYKVMFLSMWIIGIAFFILRFIKNYYNLRKLLSAAFVFKKTNKLKVVISDSVKVPFSVRMFKFYWVVIPIELLNNRTDLTLAIKHELQHHRQGDTWWAVLIEILTCIFFFNPIIYLWKNTIIEFQEFSCDEALTGQKDVLSHDYGSCLLRVAETALTNRQMYAGTTSMAVVFKNSKYFKTFLLRRIEMIVKEKKSNSKWIPICTGVMLALLTITLAYGVEIISRAKEKAVNKGSVVFDSDIQKITNDALEKALNDTRFSEGFIIVADPMTGKILAVANKDKKNIKKGNWALSLLMEPASLEKTFVIAQALEKKVTSTDEFHQCENGKYNYKGEIYRDWKTVGWKQLTTSETLSISSDICSIKIGEKLGEKSLLNMMESFGFGENGTAEDFPEARVGDNPEVDDQFIPKVALGYAFRHSPLEIIQAFGAIANGGNLMKPMLANSIKTETLRRVLSVENANKMKVLLEDVVINGTGKNAASHFYTTAGKTASARLNDYKGIDWYGVNKKHANLAGFMGFAPVNNPRVQVFVGLIDPDTDKDKTGAHGGEHAAPVFKEVAESVLAYLKVTPDKF